MNNFIIIIIIIIRELDSRARLSSLEILAYRFDSPEEFSHDLVRQISRRDLFSSQSPVDGDGWT